MAQRSDFLSEERPVQSSQVREAGGGGWSGGLQSQEAWLQSWRWCMLAGIPSFLLISLFHLLNGGTNTSLSITGV